MTVGTPGLIRILQAVEEFRKVDPEMPMQTAAVLLLVGSQEGISQGTLKDRVGVSKSALSRIFDRLSDRPGRAGLLQMRKDPDDLRYKITHLTPKGRRVVAALEHLMEPASP